MKYRGFSVFQSGRLAWFCGVRCYIKKGSRYAERPGNKGMRFHNFTNYHAKRRVGKFILKLHSIHRDRRREHGVL